MCIYLYICLYVHTITHTHTHTQIYTQTHARTHTLSLSLTNMRTTHTHTHNTHCETYTQALPDGLDSTGDACDSDVRDTPVVLRLRQVFISLSLTHTPPPNTPFPAHKFNSPLSAANIVSMSE